jgi:hypothetical protein
MPYEVERVANPSIVVIKGHCGENYESDEIGKDEVTLLHSLYRLDSGF